METRLKAIFVVLLLASSLFAQTKTDSKTFSSAMRRGSTELGIFAGGGSGFGKRSNTQMFFAGGRYGRILTPELLSGPLRGNLEYVADVIPIFAVMQPQNAFGGGFNPLILKWNFTSGKNFVPFLEAGGGVIFTNHDVPALTNNVNFTPQGGFGFHYFTREKRAITFTGKYLHISNSGLATGNSGINASIQFVLGYTWFK